MSGNSDQNSDGAQQNSGDQSQQKQSASAAPEGLPENFWDGEKGAVKTDDLIASYKDLSKFKTDTEAKFASRPESADKYEVRVPEGVELPEGVEWKFDEKSPLLAQAKELVFNAGGDQKMFDGLLAQYINENVARTSADLTKSEEVYQNEMKALGEKSKERTEAIGKFLDGNLPEDEAKALKNSLSSAKAVQALEKLIEKSNGEILKGSSQGAPSGSITQADIDSKMNDPRYWRDRDPAFMAEVASDFKKLYPGSKQTSH